MLALSLLLLATQALGGHVVQRQKTCTVYPSGNSTDDSPAIVEAFDLCGQGGRIEFLNETYWIEKVMNTTGLNDAAIDLRGTLLWSAANISYWLNNSLPIGFQNQTSAWFLGGNNILFDGHGYGTFNGNGQIWYDFTKGVSNLAGRPHALTIWNTHNSTFTGIRFVQSQMWTMTISASSYVDMLRHFCQFHQQRLGQFQTYLGMSLLLNDVQQSTINTDGADTLDSHHITFRRWEVHNGDDSIAMKRNSLLHRDRRRDRQHWAVSRRIRVIERGVDAQLFVHRDAILGYIKTWTGVQQGFPPNGGGGGTGVRASNLVPDVEFANGSGSRPRYCWSGLQGSPSDLNVASLECSGAAPCQDVRILDSDFTFATNTTVGTYSCHAVASTEGFTCQ
ncbi:glycoside hydrolase family 28 protein [Mycena rebaudengoi]|nr:glycoside hydrolase family 28 protein [Mycena rebaudengoi]